MLDHVFWYFVDVYFFLYFPFQECLINGKLETAASYLIILQNLEKPMASRQVIETLIRAIVGVFKIVFHMGTCFPFASIHDINKAHISTV